MVLNILCYILVVGFHTTDYRVLQSKAAHHCRDTPQFLMMFQMKWSLRRDLVKSYWRVMMVNFLMGKKRRMENFLMGKKKMTENSQKETKKVKDLMGLETYLR